MVAYFLLRRVLGSHIDWFSNPKEHSYLCRFFHQQNTPFIISKNLEKLYFKLPQNILLFPQNPRL